MNNNPCKKHLNFVGEVCPVCMSDENIRLQEDLEFYKSGSEAACLVIEKLILERNEREEVWVSEYAKKLISKTEWVWEEKMGKVTTTTKIWTEIINERDALALSQKLCIHILECIVAGKPGININDAELRRYDKHLAEETLKKLTEANYTNV